MTDDSKKHIRAWMIGLYPETNSIVIFPNRERTMIRLHSREECEMLIEHIKRSMREMAW
jgi:hypothetical protein